MEARDEHFCAHVVVGGMRRGPPCLLRHWPRCLEVGSMQLVRGRILAVEPPLESVATQRRGSLICGAETTDEIDWRTFLLFERKPRRVIGPS